MRSDGKCGPSSSMSTPVIHLLHQVTREGSAMRGACLGGREKEVQGLCFFMLISKQEQMNKPSILGYTWAYSENKTKLLCRILLKNGMSLYQVGEQVAFTGQVGEFIKNAYSSLHSLKSGLQESRVCTVAQQVENPINIMRMQV